MTEQERKTRSKMTESIKKELARTNPDVQITSKFPITKEDEHREKYDALYGKRGTKTVLILQRQRDFVLKVTEHIENYKNVK